MNIYSKLSNITDISKVPDEVLYKDLADITRLIWNSFNNKASLYCLILMQLDKRFEITEEVPIAGVTLRGLNYVLRVNKEAWLSIDKEIEKVGLIIHEIMHVVFDHCSTMQNYASLSLFNKAADLQINTMIQDIFGKHSLPGCTDTHEWNTVHKPQLEAIQAMFKAGNITEAEAKKQAKLIPIRPILFDDYKDKYDLTEGECINKGTNWLYNKLLEYNEQDMDDQCGAQALHDFGMKHSSDHKDQQSINKDYANSSMEVITKQKNAMVRQAVEDESVKRSIGNLPLGIQEMLKSILNPKPPVTDWRQEIRDWSGGFANTFHVRRTKMKPNLILEEGYRVRLYPNKHLLLLLDTSGSMNIEKDIPEVLEEGWNIKTVSNAKITVAEADTCVHDIWEMTSMKALQDKIEKGISGRGGTSVEFLHSFLEESKEEYTGVIYLTDGEVLPPNKRFKIPFILLKSSYGSDYYCEQWEEANYRVIKIEKDNE